MIMKYLSFEEYKKNAEKDPQWKSYLARWEYHELAIDILKRLKITKPSGVLEIGCFGAQIVPRSHTMELPDSSWQIGGYKPKTLHDARITPWPFKDERFDVVVALRVWHHLAPVQREAFLEAKRIGKYVLIACPEVEVVGKGVLREEFNVWNEGPPLEIYDLGAWGMVYLFGSV